MSWRVLLLLLAAVTASCSGGKGAVLSPSGESPHDFDYRWTGTFTLEKEEGSHRLSSHVQVSATYLSRRATDQVTYYVGEPYFAPIQEISATLDGDGLPAGQIVKTLPEREDVFLSDTHVHKIKFKTVRRGQTISYQYRQRIRDVAYLPVVRVPNLDRVSRFELIFEHPTGSRVDFELFFSRDRFTPQIRRAPTRTSITFTNVRRFVALPYYPYNRYNVLIWPRVTEGGRSLTPGTPAEFQRWYAGLFPRPTPPPPGPAWKAEVGVAEGTPLQKVTAIHDFVRHKVRYIADERDIGGIVPRPPALVLKRRYGDCKDKAYLVSRLAAALGIKVDMVLVGVDPEPPARGVRLGMFDHVIASMEVGGRRVFFDPTCRFCELGNLPEGDVEKDGLLLDPVAPRKLTIPAPAQKPTLEARVEASAGDLSRGTATITLRNRMRRVLLELRRTKAPSEVGPAVARLLSKRFYGLTLKDLRVGAVRPDHVVVSARADLSGLVVRSTRRLYLPTVPFRTVRGDVLRRRKDSHPIYLERRHNLSLRLTLEAPGYTLPRAPEVHRLGGAGVAQFSSQLLAEGDSVVVTYDHQQRRKHFHDARERETLLSYCEQYLQSRKRMYALTKKEPAGQKGGEQP